MNISYDYYRIFYYVAKYGSLTKAADALLLNQPNLTRTIKGLEAELGCPLFIRSNKGVKLTPTGEHLYEHVCAAFDHLLAAEEEISLSRSLSGGVVSIGASEIALNLYLLPILDEYRSRYPGIRIKISHLSAPDALSKLKNGLVDLAMFTAPMESDPEISGKEVKIFREVAVCGPRYTELTNRDRLTLSEIADYPIVSFGKRTSTYAFYLDFFEENGVLFSPDIEAATADQILPLVRHNLGVGFVPEHFLSQKDAEGVHRLTLTEPIPERKILLAKKRFHSLSLPAKELERLILEHADK